MKRFILLLTILITIFSCKKDNSLNTTTTVSTISIENPTQYIKEAGCYFYKNIEDVNTPIKNLKSDSYLWVDFGRKVTVIDTKKVGDDDYYKVQLPDKSIYWAKKDFFTSKFITINKANVLCYKQPDNDWATTIKLQPGDFGTLIKEEDGWINVEFKAYRPTKEGGDRKWVGNYWIKEGWTDDINTAKQAYYLYMAYYYKLIKNDDKNAIEMIKKAFSSTNEEETEISYVLRDYLQELQSNSTEEIKE
ncbi:MAG TPA: hypothetical protein PLE45_03300 [Spirochaetota bacterium]|nr:hypothetical protein [Spirochaetota bacterium]HOL56234.1 hypothetical protein [Spirochaetota bacterium]HPP04141.1 hypothetical protein [Spirochaetota bacterium]